MVEVCDMQHHPSARKPAASSPQGVQRSGAAQKRQAAWGVLGVQLRAAVASWTVRPLPVARRATRESYVLTLCVVRLGVLI